MRNGLSYSDAGKIGYLKSKEKHEERYSKIRNTYNNNPKKCKFCHKIISYEDRNKQFCNHSCCASYNNAGNRKWGKPPTLCVICGKKTKSFKRKYCSHKCHADMMWIENKKKYELADKLSYGDMHCRRFLRRYLLEKYGSVCSICKLTTWNGKDIPLIVDHIDGNSNNHSKENVRLICGNCGMQLPTFAGRNRGHGRKWRRDLYKRKI